MRYEQTLNPLANGFIDFLKDVQGEALEAIPSQNISKGTQTSLKTRTFCFS